MTTAFTVLGSPRYMAPEQLRNSKDVDGRADLWSLGAVLFQLLTGKHAFEAENNVAGEPRRAHGGAALSAAWLLTYRAELEAVVNRCLDEGPQAASRRRPSSPTALRPFALRAHARVARPPPAAKQGTSVRMALTVSSEGERVDNGDARAGGGGSRCPCIHRRRLVRRGPCAPHARARRRRRRSSPSQEEASSRSCLRWES